MNGKIESTGFVVRSYNNAHIKTAVGKLLSFDVGRVVVVVNTPQDKGATKGFLGNLLEDFRVEVIEMEEGYSWCNALYSGAKSLQMYNYCVDSGLFKESKRIRYIFNISVETKLEKSHLEAMLDTITDADDIGVVGTSYRGIKNGNEINLGTSYNHGRNTCMLINFEAYFKVGGFNPRCDSFGGMEDMEFILNMLLTTNFKYVHLDLKVPLIVGVHYEQSQKEQREQEAMGKIVALRTHLPTIKIIKLYKNY